MDVRVPHPDPPSHLPPHPIPLGLPSFAEKNRLRREALGSKSCLLILFPGRPQYKTLELLDTFLSNCKMMMKSIPEWLWGWL